MPLIPEEILSMHQIQHDSAAREISLFFEDSEICEYTLPDEELIYEEP